MTTPRNQISIYKDKKTMDDIKALQLLLAGTDAFESVPNISGTVRYCLSYVRSLLEDQE